MLFVTMEGMNTLLDSTEVEGKIKGLGRNDSTVNYIPFVDDVMIFSKVNFHFVDKIEEIYEDSANALGLIPILQKSKILFSKVGKREVRNRSNLKEGVLSVKYLGMPLHAKGLNTCHYKLIVDKMKNKIGSLGINTITSR